jgi:hypothetical protein
MSDPSLLTPALLATLALLVGCATPGTRALPAPDSRTVIDEDEGRVRLSHHGETCGFTNAIVKYPEQRLTVIVLTNRAGGEPWRLAQRLADLWLPARAEDGRHAPVETRPWPFESTPNAR